MEVLVPFQTEKKGAASKSKADCIGLSLHMSPWPFGTL